MLSAYGKLIFVFFFCILVLNVKAQTNFMQFQRTYSRVDNAFKQKEDTLRKQFAQKQLQWPPQQLYLRSFKYDSQLEVWIKEIAKDTFSLFKTYKVCALSGALGPKRMEGDFQVPEGFYYINEFNPKSAFHLSLGLNYPNAADSFFSDPAKPGGDIYIHGGCVTTGCIPIKDVQVEELYVLATSVKEQGQDFIPVHIFPIQYNNKKSLEFFALNTKGNEAYQLFALNMQDAYDYFNKQKKLPIIAIDKKGEYLLLK
jgi:murein L,D-transpeptidase YafK